MKNLVVMKCIQYVLAAVWVSFFISCNKNEVSGQKLSLREQEEISQETREFISSLHFNTDYVEVIDLLLPDGSTEKTFLVEGDISITLDQLKSMRPDKVTTKQYRIYNLVSSPRTVQVIGYTGSSQGLTWKQRTALQRAVENYNALNIGLNFTLSFGANYSSYDIVVYQNPNGEAGGVAGFPENGDPYKWVQIFSGMENFGTAINEHVLTHEIGHAVGLRHTDWFSRQSCGPRGESAGTDGAVHIPGTPSGYDSTSLMRACFSAYEDGNFGYYDEVALEFLY